MAFLWKCCLLFVVFSILYSTEVISANCYCGPHGKCLIEEGFKCVCDPGFTGSFCEYDFKDTPCASYPCLNGANCSNLLYINDYICDCKPGYLGRQCEKYREGPRCTTTPCCAANPCLNGGNCTDYLTIESYSCSCQDDTYGTNCEYKYLNITFIVVGTVVGTTLLSIILLLLFLMVRRRRMRSLGTNNSPAWTLTASAQTNAPSVMTPSNQAGQSPYTTTAPQPFGHSKAGPQFADYPPAYSTLDPLITAQNSDHSNPPPVYTP